jgi:hypothetical protein
MKNLVLIACVSLLAACSTMKYDVSVNGFADASKSQLRSYVLLPGNTGVTADDLEFKEFASYVDRVLTSRGYQRAADPRTANIAIFLTYGIGEPQEHSYTYSIPIYGQTGVSSAYTTGTLSSYGNTGTYSGTTTYTPSYGIVGATTHRGTYTTCMRFMGLEAEDIQQYVQAKKIVPTWSLHVASEGRTCDLRQVIPVMVGASSQYIGTNTGKIINVLLKPDDPRITAVTGVPQQ